MKSLKAIRYGSQLVPGPQAFFQSRWEQEVEFAFYVFLLKIDDVNVLIDCGMDDTIVFNQMLAGNLGTSRLIETSPRENAVQQLLRREGLRPQDIDVVCFTHFHADHCANARLFDRARFMVSSTGWKEAMRLRADLPEMMPDPLFPSPVLDFLDEIKETRLDLVDDGPSPIPEIAVKHVGGHTKDSAAFVLELDDCTAVIPGDTVWLYDNLKSNVPVGAAADTEECYRAMRWLNSVEDAEILPTHDPAILERYPGGAVRATVPVNS